MRPSARRRAAEALSPARALEGLSTQARSAMVLPIAEARKDAARKLEGWLAEGKSAGAFTAQRWRAAVIRLGLAQRKMSKWPAWLLDLKDGIFAALARFGIQAGEMGAQNMLEEYARLMGRFEGVSVAPMFEAADVMSRRLLLERFRTSAARYAGAMREDIRLQLRIAVVNNETIFETAKRLRQLGGPKGLVALRGVVGEEGALAEWMSEGLFRRYGHWADRLARTEILDSYNQVHDDALTEAHKEDPDIRRMWDAAHDSRTCPICRPLDGQVTDVGKPFPGGYDRPPAHPMCRCSLVPWKDRWDSAARAA